MRGRLPTPTTLCLLALGLAGTAGAAAPEVVTILRDQLPLYEAFGYRRQPFAASELEAPVTMETVPVVRGSAASTRAGSPR